MSDCEFEPDDGNGCRCTVCGYVYRQRHGRRKPPRRVCPVLTRHEPGKLASLLIQHAPELRGHLLAIQRWQAAGYPVRTGERVAELLAICRDCPDEWYLPGPERCFGCRCPQVDDMVIRLAHKAAMRTEICPRGHWRSRISGI